jgi:enoyl-CoA hydratase/carnithine racemase
MSANHVRVARKDGRARAFEIATSGTLYDAEAFERLNIVNRVLPAGDLQTEAEAFASRLAAGPTKAFDAVKTILRHWDKAGVVAADQTTLDMIAPVMATDDATSTIKSFLAEGPGRAPRAFSGR